MKNIKVITAIIVALFSVALGGCGESPQQKKDREARFAVDLLTGLAEKLEKESRAQPRPVTNYQTPPRRDPYVSPKLPAWQPPSPAPSGGMPPRVRYVCLACKAGRTQSVDLPRPSCYHCEHLMVRD